MNIFSTNKAVTLMEIIIVIVLLGIIAGYATPMYFKSINKAHERDAVVQLSGIHAANEIVLTADGEYLDGTDGDLSWINTNFGLAILSNELTYDYDRLSATTYTVTASYNTAFTIRINQENLSATNPCCSAGTCLTLPDC